PEEDRIEITEPASEPRLRLHVLRRAHRPLQEHALHQFHAIGLREDAGVEHPQRLFDRDRPDRQIGELERHGSDRSHIHLTSRTVAPTPRIGWPAPPISARIRATYGGDSPLFGTQPQACTGAGPAL